MSENNPQINDLVREMEAFVSALPTSKESVGERYVRDFHDFVDQLETLTQKDLSRFRISGEDIKTPAEQFKEEMGVSVGRLPRGFDKPMVKTDILRSNASRLLSQFPITASDTGVVQQHIVVTGSGNQTVVGVAGGPLSQHAKHEVRPGDDLALISGLEAIEIGQDKIDELKRLLASQTDLDGKKHAVRSWITSFTTDVLSGAIGGTIASQAPAALAMALGYLS